MVDYATLFWYYCTQTLIQLLLQACKSGLRRLTYRKTYARTKSNTDMEQVPFFEKKSII